MWNPETNIRGPMGPPGPEGPQGPPGADGSSGSGGTSVTISDTPPPSPTAGSLWWESDTGNLYIFYDDGTSTQWVLAVPQVSASAIGAATTAYVDAQDALRVLKAGDTMTGDLKINSTSPSGALTTGALTVAGGVGVSGQINANQMVVRGASSAFIVTDRGGVSANDWTMYAQSSGYRVYNGGLGADAFTLDAATLNARFNGNVFVINSRGTPANGNLFFGDTGSAYITYTGGAYTLTGGALNVGSLTPTTSQLIVKGRALFSGGTPDNGDGTPPGVAMGFNAAGDYGWIDAIHTGISTKVLRIQSLGAPTTFGGNISIASTSTDASINFGNVAGKYLLYQNAGTIYSLVGGHLSLAMDLRVTGTTHIGFNRATLPTVTCAGTVCFSGAGTMYGLAFRPAADNAVVEYFCNAAGAGVGGINISATATTFATSSDERLKEDLKSFDAGNIVDNTKVYDFAWRSTGERSYGVIAQQAIDVYPLAVMHIEKCEAGDEFWGVDYSKYVPVLLQELKALRARVAQLEGKPTLPPKRKN